MRDKEKWDGGVEACLGKFASKKFLPDIRRVCVLCEMGGESYLLYDAHGAKKHFIGSSIHSLAEGNFTHLLMHFIFAFYVNFT